MPLYEYRCAGCGQEFERYVATVTAAVSCPACTGANVKRKLSLFAFKADGGAPMSTAMPSGGSCCGGGCSCH